MPKPAACVRVKRVGITAVGTGDGETPDPRENLGPTLTLGETAKRLRMSPWAVWRLVLTRELYACDLGLGRRRRVARIEEVELDRFLREHPELRERPEPKVGRWPPWRRPAQS